MGGRGSGGHRPGSGSKPGVDIPDDAPLPVVDAPDGMPSAVREVWDELALLAIQQRTLTPQTVRRFVLLCRQIVRDADMDEAIESDGFTYEKVTVDGAGQEHRERKANPLLAQQRAIQQRIEAGLTAFRLAPMGKPLLSQTSKEKPKSALEVLQARRPVIRAVK